MIRFLPYLVVSASLATLSSSVIAIDPVSFSRDVAPVLVARCATCHLTGEEEGRLALHAAAAFGNLVNVPSVESKLMRVQPKSPEQSYLLLKLEGRHLDAGGTGARMPLGQSPLDEATLKLIRVWILEGALQN